jgi:hypothetical protein
MYTLAIPLTWEDQKSFKTEPILKYINEALDEYKFAIISSTSSALSYNFDTKEIMDGNYCKYCNRAKRFIPASLSLFAGYYNYTKGYTLNLRIKPALKEK